MRRYHEFPLPLFQTFLLILSPRFFPPDAEERSAEGPSAEEKRFQTEVRECLSSTFKIPAAFWRSVALEASGFFGCQDHEDTDGLQRYSMYDKLIRNENDIDEIGTFFRFLIKEAKQRKPTNAYDVRKAEFDYEWYKLGFFTDWHPSGKVIALCFGFPETLRDSIKKAVTTNGMKMPLVDPFALHTVLVEEVVALFDQALWHWRDLVRGIEKVRANSRRLPISALTWFAEPKSELP